MVVDPETPIGEDRFVSELHEAARASFLVACPLFTVVTVAWTVFDALLAPEWWLTFLVYRWVNAAISVGLFTVSWRRWTDAHMALLLGWVLSIAATIALMLPVVPAESFAFFVMGYSLCVVGLTTFSIFRPIDVGVSLAIFGALFGPTILYRGVADMAVVGSTFFLATLCLAAMVQAVHHHRMAREGFRSRLELAGARDQALSADRAKSAFLARMSHELRTPLNAIIGYAELVGEELDELDESLRDLERIEGAGHHLLALINDVLDLSKIAAGELEVRAISVEVRACLEEVRPLAERLVAQKRNALRWQVGEGVARADPLRLRQVVLNLISNAAKFTEAGTVSVALSCSASHVIIDVRDDGIGMTARQLESAFLPFVQVHDDHATYGGTGLGLALSRQLADRMGGSLTGESQPGEGSCFRVVLPSGL